METKYTLKTLEQFFRQLSKEMLKIHSESGAALGVFTTDEKRFNKNLVMIRGLCLANVKILTQRTFNFNCFKEDTNENRKTENKAITQIELDTKANQAVHRVDSEGTKKN